MCKCESQYAISAIVMWISKCGWKYCFILRLVVMWTGIYQFVCVYVCCVVELVVLRWSCCFKCVFFSLPFFVFIDTLCWAATAVAAASIQKWFVRLLQSSLSSPVTVYLNSAANSHSNEIQSCVRVSLFCTFRCAVANAMKLASIHTNSTDSYEFWKFQRHAYEKKKTWNEFRDKFSLN